MKKSTSFIIFFTFLLYTIFFSLYSCSKNEDDQQSPINNSDVVPEKTNVQTYEVIYLKTDLILADKYSAKFGKVSVELFKTSDTTLAFIVPEVESGEQLLDFELSKIKFNVTKTLEVDADQLVTSIFKNFDTQVSAMNSTTPEEIASIESLNLFKQEVLGLFNSLTAKDKRQNVLFYQANKDLFKSFMDNPTTKLNASNTLKLASQSTCPLTDYKSYYTCIAESVSWDAYLLDIDLGKASEIMGMENSFLSAIQLLITGARPKIQLLRGNLGFLLNKKWILSDEIFKNIQTVFTDDVDTDLNLNGKFRTISPDYKDNILLNKEPIFFFDRIKSTHMTWQLFPFLGSFPDYVNDEEAIGLSYWDVEISDISNPNVKYIGRGGEISPYIKFKSLSGNEEETFSYKITVRKQGFIEEKTVNNAKLMIATDSLAIYKAAVVGNWTMTWHDSSSQSQDQIDKFTFNSDGDGIYYWMKSAGSASGQSIDPGSPVYRITWSVRRVSTGVWYLDFIYPDRGWSSSTQIFLTPNVHSGDPSFIGLYFLGIKD
ncbi:hypothetical protein [Flavobacterium sp. 5]|uniref:hypothetical protein n=1 Tax=Flavobacterium sp. 5 TaxID=2035199 RepID=UPI000C2B98BC|nr:hypothetical protein [Flavobacterium sp. 5]PKB15011.1 hypothetical protein CLU82_0064 [Flavobacterium sp. 5]